MNIMIVSVTERTSRSGIRRGAGQGSLMSWRNSCRTGVVDVPVGGVIGIGLGSAGIHTSRILNFFTDRSDVEP